MSDEAERAARGAMIAQQYEGIYPPFEAFYIQSIIYAAAVRAKSGQFGPNIAGFAPLLPLTCNNPGLGLPFPR